MAELQTTQGSESAGSNGLPPTPMSRRERRRAETRERIFEAAMRLLADHEFDDVTVEMITEAADVGKGTFFNYFDSKEAVVSTMFETNLRLLTEMMQSAAEARPEQAGDTPETGRHAPAPIWRQLVTMACRVAERDGDSKRLTRTLIALSLTNPHVRAAHLSMKTHILELVGDFVLLAQAHGELRDDLSIAAITDHLSKLYFSTLFTWAQTETEESLPEAMERTLNLAWSGLRPQEK